MNFYLLSLFRIMLDCCFNLQSKLNLLSFREYLPEIHDVPPKKNFAVGVFGTEETIFVKFSKSRCH